MKKDKMVIVMRTDLGMGAGKMIAQGGHAVAKALLYLEPGADDKWIEQGMKKVVVGADSEEVLLQAVAKALELGIPASLITDAGLTQVDPDTKTCAAIGPAKDKLIEKVTGSLKLLP
jgi:PTH2 family peptidyl-tRNA hydrolase